MKSQWLGDNLFKACDLKTAKCQDVSISGAVQKSERKDRGRKSDGKDLEISQENSLLI